MNELETLTLRVAALERQNRRVKRALLVLGLPALATLLMAAQTPAVSDVVRTRSLEIIDGGKAVVILAGVPGEGGQVMVFQPGGARGAALSASANGGMIDIADRSGQSVGYFDAKPGGGYLSIKNTAHREVGRIFAAENTRRGTINLWDDADTQIFRAP